MSNIFFRIKQLSLWKVSTFLLFQIILTIFVQLQRAETSAINFGLSALYLLKLRLHICIFVRLI